MYKDTPYPLRLAAVLISIALVILGLYLLQDLLILLAFSMILAMLVLPVCTWLESKGLPRSLAIVLCLLIMFAFIGLLLLLAIGQIAEFASDWPMFIRKSEKWLAGLQSFLSQNLNISRKKQMVEVSNQTINLLKNSGGIISTTFGTAIHGITTMIIVPIFVFFFLYYRQFFSDFLSRVFPTTEPETLKGIMHKTVSVVQSYLVGLLAVMFIVALLCCVGFWWIGVDYFMFFGCLTGILLVIPYIGIWIGAALPVILTLISLGPNYALGLIAWVAFVQFVEANFITPMVIGSKVSMNPMVAMLALLAGEMIWGIPGLILALPLTAILKVIFDHVPALKAYGFLLGEAPDRLKRE
ncbi:AI-2E family transporter [Aquirufa sp.]|jgi:predicted PurR-regulated permease PerM|uniref:AI-2E family transporter n=1 Tax=Aquirufa sp. TaxID=2676249 RepID=UPI0037C0DF58